MSDEQHTNTASSRAREILGSLKERREFFESRIAQNAARAAPQQSIGSSSSSHSLGSSQRATSSKRMTTAAFVKPVAVRPPLFSPEQVESISRQLNDSIQERKIRLSRVSSRQGTPDNSMDHNHKVWCTSSEHSTGTMETGEMTVSPFSSPGDSAGVRVVDSQSVLTALAPKLNEIQESLVADDEKKGQVGGNTSTTDDSSSQLTTSSSSSSSSADKSTQGSLTKQEDAVDDEGEDSIGEDSAPLQADKPSVFRALEAEQTTQTSRLVFRESPLESPELLKMVVAAPAVSFDASERRPQAAVVKPISKDDLDLPRELVQQPLTKSQPPLSPALLMSSVSLQSSTSSLSTKEDRAAYLGHLYSPDARRHSAVRTTPRQERQQIYQLLQQHRAETRAAAKQKGGSSAQPGHPPKLLSGPSVLEDDRRKLLESLRCDLQKQKRYNSRRPLIRIIPVPPAGSQHTRSSTDEEEDDDSLVISDESSFECGSDDSSDTSGWASSSSDDDYEHQDDLSDIDAVLVRRQPGHRQRTTPLTSRRISYVGRRKHVVEVPVVPVTLETAEVTSENVQQEGVEAAEPLIQKSDDGMPEPLLFVSRETANALCKANGGMYALAFSSSPGCLTAVPRLPVASSGSSRPASATFLCLATDFRCGAYGSLYDLAVRSGCKVHEPCSPPPEAAPMATPSEVVTRGGRQVPCKGGHYEIALQSGLSKESLRSKRAYTVFTSSLPPRREEAKVVPESVSDRRCGTTGTLHIAQHSGIEFAPVEKSLQYIGERTGLRF